MLEYDDVKRVFTESFNQVPYKKITGDEYDEIRKTKGIIFSNNVTSPAQLQIEGFKVSFISETKGDDICFAINYSVDLTTLYFANQVSSIPEKIMDFISNQNYKNIVFHLHCEGDQKLFSGTFLAYAQI